MNVQNTTSKSNPALSIIMPSLNVATYIQQCLDSVCNQTLCDIEILCVDAGSTDGTGEILQKYAEKDSRIKLIHSDQKSYGYQMNLGLQIACGDYIGIVETDDYVDPDMFEQLYCLALSHDADVVKSNYFCHTQGVDHFRGLFSGLPYEKTFCPKDHLSLFMRTPSIWSGIYNREFLKKHKICFLETPGASFQDTSFILKVWICAEKVCLTKTAYVHYRMDNPNSSVKSPDKMFFVRDEMTSVHSFLESLPDKKAQYQRIIWDREADSYEWNYRRLADELKYEFLVGIQNRFQYGITYHCYEREHLRWPVRKMINEVAENPLIFLYGKINLDLFQEKLLSAPDNQLTIKKLKMLKIKGHILQMAGILYDVFSMTKNYGFIYCIQQIKL